VAIGAIPTGCTFRRAKGIDMNKVKAFVIFWTLAVAAGFVAEVMTDFVIPLQQLVVFAGLIVGTFVGIDEISTVLESSKLPQGVGVDSDRTPLWLVVVWSVLMLAALTLQAVFPESQLPIAEVVAFAGVLTAEYVGGESGNKQAARSGKGQ